MKFHHKSHAPRIVLCGVGLAVTAIAALMVVWFNHLPQSTRAAEIAKISPTAGEYEKQKSLIDSYIQNSLAIENAYAAKQISAAEAKKRALALYVPAVLKDRHLAWVIALDKDDVSGAATAVQDYQLFNTAR